MKWRKPSRPRCPDHDYRGPGVYFVTCCARHRIPLFGKVLGSRVELSRYGREVASCWELLPRHYPHLQLDQLVIMPDHLHGILVLRPPVTSNNHDLFEVVRALKSFSARRINELRETRGSSVWQRGFYHTVVENRAALEGARQYIRENPLRWATKHGRVLDPPMFVPVGP